MKMKKEAENTPPASTKHWWQKARHRQAPEGTIKHPGQKTCQQKALEAENMLEQRGTAPGDE